MKRFRSFSEINEAVIVGPGPNDGANGHKKKRHKYSKKEPKSEPKVTWDDVIPKLKRMKRKKIAEDAPTMNAGSGAIPGLGVSNPSKGPNWGEPGVHPRNQPKKNRSPDPKSIVMAMMRRAPVKNMVESCRGNDFAGGAVFEVSSNLFYELKMCKRKGKHWRTYLNEDDCYKEIREYAARNRKGKIMIQNETTGEMMVVRYS